MSGSSTNLRAAFDTNLVVSGVITPNGYPNQVLRSWQEGLFALVTSPALTAEIRDVLNRAPIRRRHSLGPADIERLIADLEQNLRQPLPLADLPVHCRDPKDDKVLACALGASADYIVTGDADLLVLDGHPALGSLRIVTPSEFLNLLRSR